MPPWVTPALLGALLGVVGYGGRRVLASLDHLHDRLGDVSTTVAVHESRLARLEESR